MDARIAIWNLLHDGEITTVSREPNSLTLFVNIPYLRRRLNPLGDSFVLKLGNVTKLGFRSFGDVEESLEDVLEVGRLDILGTDSEDMPAVVDTSLGRLTIEFETLELATDTGGSVSLETIDRIAREYWREWEEKAAKNP